MPRDADELVELLDLETIDDNLFRGTQMPTSRRMVFGGQVAAQALVAGSRTVVEPFTVHSLHSYFLQPGDPSTPTIYDVEHLRDGRSFATRRVTARQHGRPVYSQTLSFHRPEAGHDHQEAAPDVPGPDDPACRPVQRGSADERHLDQWAVAELRLVPADGDPRRGTGAGEDGRPGRQQMWMRVSSRLPDDAFWHRAAFTYLSDMALVGAALAPHGVALTSGEVFAASLDHAVWFHRPFRADEWWLYDQASPAARGGRGLVLGRVFSGSGELVASVAQEALVRRREAGR